jgi:hypothetical protein
VKDLTPHRRKEEQTMNRKQGCWVGLFGLSLIFFLGFAFVLLSSTNLLLHGNLTQGTVVAVKSSRCGKAHEQSVWVRFIAQSGHTYISTVNRCNALTLYTASPGDSVPIVYLPDDPTMIALVGDLLQPVIGTILFGLILLILGISKALRKPSLPP